MSEDDSPVKHECHPTSDTATHTPTHTLTHTTTTTTPESTTNDDIYTSHNQRKKGGKAERSSSTDFSSDECECGSGTDCPPGPKIDWRDLPKHVQRNIICNPEGKLLKLLPSEVCDACPYCNDTCTLDHCAQCMIKRKRVRIENKYSYCEVRRNRNLASCWITVDSAVYDATSYLEKHPGGVTSILRHSGGINCSEHLYFHSSRGKKKWKALSIGKVVYCKGGEGDPNCPPRPLFSQGKCSIS
jgi:cytochrome b involved in lipid metabolism